MRATGLSEYRSTTDLRLPEIMREWDEGWLYRGYMAVGSPSNLDFLFVRDKEAQNG
jgi:hypothetical protein